MKNVQLILARRFIATIKTGRTYASALDEIQSEMSIYCSIYPENFGVIREALQSILADPTQGIPFFNEINAAISES